MKTQLSLDVRAEPQRLFDLARDVGRWPELLPHYRSVTLAGEAGGRRTWRMVAVRHFGPLPVPVAWRAENWSDGSDETDLRLHFRHVRGVTRGMQVTWHIRPAATGARVTIEHDFTRRLPFLGPDGLPRVVDRFFVRPIATRTLARFRTLAETGD